MPTQIEGENTAAIAQNSAAIADLVHALAVETARARSAATEANTYTDTSVAGFSSDLAALGATLRSYVNEHAASGMTYKGSASKTSLLPTTGNRVGDMYNVFENGHNYVWAGSAWDDCGGVVDTSNLVSWTEFWDHQNKTSAHVSPEDRTRWNTRPTVGVGKVSQTPYTSSPTVTNVGTTENPVLNFGIPAGRPFTYADFSDAQLEALRGPQGNTGPAPAVGIGAVSIGANEDDGTVTLTPDSNGTRLFNFRLPKGPPMSFDDLTSVQKDELKGEPGNAAKKVVIRNVCALNPSDTPYMDKVSETPSDVTFDVGIPRGYSPRVSLGVIPLDAGSPPTVTQTTDPGETQTSVTFTLGIPAGTPGRLALANAPYDEYLTEFSLTDHASNLVRVTGSTTSVVVQLPATARGSRGDEAREFTMVLQFDEAWTGNTFSVVFTRPSSSPQMYLHFPPDDTLDFTGASPGDIMVIDFAEMFEDHYLVSVKTLTDPIEATYP